MKCKHISSSRIFTFQKCEFAYWLGYHRHPTLDQVTVPLVMGRLVHSVLENVGKHKGEDLKTQFDTAWKTELNQLDAEERATIEETDDATYKNITYAAIQRHGLRFFDIGRKDIRREVNFKLTLPNGTPISGIIDVVHFLPNDIVEILDWKSSKTKPKFEELDENVQLRFYDLAASLLYPGKDIVTTIDFL